MKLSINTIIFFLLFFCTSKIQAKYKNDTDLSGFPLYNADASPEENRQLKVDSHTNYRQLMSELGTVFAPSFLSPAETLGYMGYAININYGFTTINNTSTYWKDGMHGDPASIMQTVGFDVRKGMWFPLPGFEIGAGLKYLTQSHMYAPHIMAKFSINEGYFKWPFPAVAFRGFGSRVMGSQEVDLTLVSLDLSLSKSFGLNSTVNLIPYAGFNYLMILADSKVIDFTPGIDSLNNSQDQYESGITCTSADCNYNLVFDDQDMIVRNRLFAGVQVMFYKFTVTLEGVWTFGGSSTDEIAIYTGGNSIQYDKIKDKSTLQHTYTISLGWNY